MSYDLRLDELPVDVLCMIFEYCHAFDLLRLSTTCSLFNNIINHNFLWLRRANQPLVTNQNDDRFKKRCFKLLLHREKWQVTFNWQYGKYKKKVHFTKEIKRMPWIYMTNNTLWWNGCSELYAFKRDKPFLPENTIFKINVQSDICKFVVGTNFITTGHRNGNLMFWPKTVAEQNFQYYRSIHGAHQFDVNAVDEVSNLILSGSGDGFVKVWKLKYDLEDSTPIASTNVLDRVWSVVADPSQSKYAVGTSGKNDQTCLKIYDLERSHNLQHLWQYGAGILDMVWDNENTLLTCGYDTYIRKWDLRIGKCVNSWSDPTDTVIYCISSDYQYSILAGTQYHYKAVLWDQRQSKYIQIYFLKPKGTSNTSSPIYSLSFDSRKLYAASDRSLIELDFGGRPTEGFNYRRILHYNRNG